MLVFSYFGMFLHGRIDFGIYVTIQVLIRCFSREKLNSWNSIGLGRLFNSWSVEFDDRSTFDRMFFSREEFDLCEVGLS